MAGRSLTPRLQDIIETSELIRSEMFGISLDAFESNQRKRWLIERGIEIISEASRHLTDEMKARHPEIPWRKVAGIGNVLRHDYGHVAAPVIWNSVAGSAEGIGRIASSVIGLHYPRGGSLRCNDARSRYRDAIGSTF